MEGLQLEGVQPTLLETWQEGLQMLQLEGLQLEELAMPLLEGLAMLQLEGRQLEELAMLQPEGLQLEEQERLLMKGRWYSCTP